MFILLSTQVQRLCAYVDAWGSCMVLHGMTLLLHSLALHAALFCPSLSSASMQLCTNACARLTLLVLQCLFVRTCTLYVCLLCCEGCARLALHTLHSARLKGALHSAGCLKWHVYVNDRPAALSVCC